MGKKHSVTAAAAFVAVFLVMVAALAVALVGSPALAYTYSGSDICRMKDTGQYIATCPISIDTVTKYSGGTCQNFTIFEVSLTSSAIIDSSNTFIATLLSNDTIPLLPANPGVKVSSTKLFLVPDIAPQYESVITVSGIEKITQVHPQGAYGTQLAVEDCPSGTITYTVVENGAIFNPATGKISITLTDITPNANVVLGIIHGDQLVEAERYDLVNGVSFSSENEFNGRDARELRNQEQYPIFLVFWTGNDDAFAVQPISIKGFEDFYAEVSEERVEGRPSIETAVPILIENVGGSSDSYTISVETPSTSWIVQQISTLTITSGESKQLSIGITPPKTFRNDAELTVVITSGYGVTHEIPVTFEAARQVIITPELYVQPLIQVNEPFTATAIINVNTTVDSDAYYYLYTDPFIKFESETGTTSLSSGSSQLSINGTARNPCALSTSDSIQATACVQIVALSEIVREMAGDEDMDGVSRVYNQISALQWSIRDSEPLVEVSSFLQWLSEFILTLSEGEEYYINQMKLEVHVNVQRLQDDLDRFIDKLFDETQGGSCSIVSSANVHFGILAFKNLTLASASEAVELTASSLIGVKIRDESGIMYVNPEDMEDIIVRQDHAAQLTMFLTNSLSEAETFTISVPITTRFEVYISEPTIYLEKDEEVRIHISITDLSSGIMDKETVAFTIAAGPYAEVWPITCTVRELACDLETLSTYYVAFANEDSFSVALSNGGDIEDTYAIRLEGDATWLALNATSITIPAKTAEPVVLLSNAVDALEGNEYDFVLYVRSHRSPDVECAKGFTVIPTRDVNALLTRYTAAEYKYAQLKTRCGDQTDAKAGLLQAGFTLANAKVLINSMDAALAEDNLEAVESQLEAVELVCGGGGMTFWIVLGVFVVLAGGAVYYFKVLKPGQEQLAGGGGQAPPLAGDWTQSQMQQQQMQGGNVSSDYYEGKPPGF